MNSVGADRIRILYIAHYFPPLGGVAALRSLKLIKYLSLYGIDCTVLTAHPFGLRDPRDQSLLSEIPSQTEIHRYWAPDLSWFYKILWGFRLHKVVDWISRNLMTPDAMILAHPMAWLTLQKVMKTGPKPALAVITGGPFSLMPLGYKLKARYQVPYICDWRDEWTNNAQRINRGYPSQVKSRELGREAKILRQAAACVYLTQMMRQNFVSNHPFVENKSFRVIPNGFDEEDFQGFLASEENRAKLRILYTGSFYDRIQPDNLWSALSELVTEQDIDPGRIEILIIGNNSPAFVYGTFHDNPTIRSIINFQPFAPHQECIRQMQSADALLIYIPSGENSASILTGKLFDYLRSKKPILCVAPVAGLAAQTVIEAGTGLVADYDDTEGLKAALIKLWTLWEQNKLSELTANELFISKFSRQAQAAELNELIREVLNG